MSEIFNVDLVISNYNTILDDLSKLEKDFISSFSKTGETIGQNIASGINGGVQKATNSVGDLAKSFDGATSKATQTGNAVDGIGQKLSRIVEIATGIGLERIFESGLGGIKNFIGGAITLAGNLQETRIGFEAMTGSAKIAGDLLQKLSDFGKKTPFELPDLQQNAQRLLAVGFSAKSILPIMEDMGNISAVVGRDKLPFLVRALGDVKVAGRLMGGEIKQFQNAGVPILELLGKQMGVTSGQARSMATDGKIAFKDVAMALQDFAKNKAPGIMEKLSMGYKGVISNIKDAFDVLTRSIIGMTEKGDVVAGGFFDRLSKSVNSLGIVIGNFTALVQGKIDFSQFLQLSGFSKQASGQIIALGNGIKFVFDILGKGANLIGSVLNSPIGTVVGTLVIATIAFTRTQMVIGSLIGSLKGLGLAFINLQEVKNINSLFGGVSGAINSLKTTIATGLASALATARIGMAKISSAMSTFRANPIGVIRGVLNSLKTTIATGLASTLLIARVGMAKISSAMSTFRANPTAAIAGVFARISVVMRTGFAGLRTIAMTGVKGIFGALKGLVMGFVGFLTSPIVLLIGALGILFAIWQTNFLGIQDFTNSIVQNIGNTLLGFSKYIMDNIDGISKGIRSGINFIIATFNVLSKYLTGPVVATFAFLAKSAISLVGFLATGILKTGAFLLKNFGGQIKGMAKYCISQLRTLGIFAIDFGGGLIQIFGGISEYVTGIFQADWKKMAVGMINIFGGVGGAMLSIADGIINVVVNMINSVIGLINSVLENPLVQKGLEAMGMGGAKVSTVSASNMSGGFTGMIDGLKASLGDNDAQKPKNDAVKNQFKGMMDGLEKSVENADTDAMGEAMNGMADGIMSSTLGAIDSIGKGAKGAIDNPVQIQELNEGATAGIKSSLQSLANGLTQAGNGIKGVKLGTIQDPIGMIKGLLGFGGDSEDTTGGEITPFADSNDLAKSMAEDRADYNKDLEDEPDAEGKSKKKKGGGEGDGTKQANDENKLEKDQQNLAKKDLEDKIKDEKELAKEKADTIKQQKEADKQAKEDAKEINKEKESQLNQQKQAIDNQKQLNQQELQNLKVNRDKSEVIQNQIELLEREKLTANDNRKKEINQKLAELRLNYKDSYKSETKQYQQMRDTIMAKNQDLEKQKMAINNTKKQLILANKSIDQTIKDQAEKFKAQLDASKNMAGTTISNLEKQKDIINDQISKGAKDKYSIDLAKYLNTKYKTPQMSQSQINQNNQSVVNNSSSSNIINQNYNPAFTGFISGLGLIK